MKTRFIPGFLMAATLTAGLFPLSPTQAADSPSSASPAEALLRQAAQTLQSAQSVHADFEETDTYPGLYQDLAQRGTLTLAHPDRLHITIHRFRRVSAADSWTASGNDTESVSDGKTYVYTFLHPHSAQTRQQAVTPTALNSALKGLPPLAPFFATESASPATDDGTLPGQDGSARLLPSVVWEGKPYQVVQYSIPSSKTGGSVSAQAYIGADYLIHRLIYRTDSDRGTITKEWTLHQITLNTPVPDSTFAATPPAEATPLNRSQRPPLLPSGSQAPDFTVYDASGKPVRLSDYHGKTVVLDFWATWCWPCNQSLPHTEKVVQSYRDKGVITLAVAIWDSKAGFDLWLQKHHYPDIRFAIDPEPQGKDVATTLYHVSATPTAYVIDGNGKIVTSITGYTGPSPELQSAIDMAQAAKTAQAR